MFELLVVFCEDVRIRVTGIVKDVISLYEYVWYDDECFVYVFV